MKLKIIEQFAAQVTIAESDEAGIVYRCLQYNEGPVPLYEVQRAQFEYVETGDVENGPSLDAYLGPWQTIGEGVSGASPENLIEQAIDEISAGAHV